jgi:hypothetical protein
MCNKYSKEYHCHGNHRSSLNSERATESKCSAKHQDSADWPAGPSAMRTAPIDNFLPPVHANSVSLRNVLYYTRYRT